MLEGQLPSERRLKNKSGAKDERSSLAMKAKGIGLRIDREAEQSSESADPTI